MASVSSSPRLATLSLAAASIIHIRIGVCATLPTGQDRLASGLTPGRRLGLVQCVRQILVGRGLPARTLVRRRLGGVAVGVRPVSETAHTGLFTDLTRNVWVYGIHTEQLAIELVVGVGHDVVLLIGGHHQVGEGISDTIEEEAAIFVFFWFGGCIL